MEETRKVENQEDEDILIRGLLRESSPQLIHWWDRFWARIKRLGMNDIAMRAGSALATIGLVGLAVWAMDGFFIGAEMADPGDPALDASGGEIPALLPEYEGVAPVTGVSRSADSSTTDSNAEVQSRYEFVTHEVVEGDSIWDIAQDYGLNPETILWANPGLRDNPAAIYPGWTLDIPPVDGVVQYWVEGDGLNSVSSFFGVTPEDIVNWPGNNLSMETIGDFALPNIEPDTKIFAPGGTRPFQDWTTILFTRDETAESRIWGAGKCAPTNLGPVGTGTYVYPTTVRGVLGYEFTPEVNHWGVDLGGGEDSPIFAVDHGVVVYAGWSEWGYGNVIAVDHGNAIQTIYAHLNSFAVECGEFVYQGDVIGYMGSTGNSSGPHLHFEIRSGSSRLNPHKYID
jgi:LysM repeat protein